MGMKQYGKTNKGERKAELLEYGKRNREEEQIERQGKTKGASESISRGSL